MKSAFLEYMTRFRGLERYRDLCVLLENRNYSGVIRGNAGVAHFDEYGGVDRRHVMFVIRSISCYYSESTIPNRDIEEAILDLFGGDNIEITLAIKYWIYFLKSYECDSLCDKKIFVLRSEIFVKRLEALLPQLLTSEYFCTLVKRTKRENGELISSRIPYIESLVSEINEYLCKEGGLSIKHTFMEVN